MTMQKDIMCSYQLKWPRKTKKTVNKEDGNEENDSVFVSSDARVVFSY
jgi:hypothetical protein